MERKAYPSDLTDAQWKILAPLLPGAKPGGGHVRLILGKSSTASNTSYGQDVPGGCFHMTFRRGRRCTSTSAGGRTMEPGKESTRRSVRESGEPKEESGLPARLL